MRKVWVLITTSSHNIIRVWRRKPTENEQVIAYSQYLGKQVSRKTAMSDYYLAEHIVY